MKVENDKKAYSNNISNETDHGYAILEGIRFNVSSQVKNNFEKDESILSFGEEIQSLSGIPMVEVNREELEAKLKIVEARNETQIARLEGKFDTIEARIAGKLDSIAVSIERADSYNRDSRLIILASLVASVLAITGVLVAMATYGDALFGRGMNVRDLIQTTIKETHEEMKTVEPPQTPQPAQKKN